MSENSSYPAHFALAVAFMSVHLPIATHTIDAYHCGSNQCAGDNILCAIS